ncbi:MAG: cell division protease FtsH, partial [Glaciecola sp.]
STAPTPAPSVYARASDWLRARRRRHLSRTGKLGAGKAQMSMIASLAALLLAVVWSLQVLSPAPTGTELTLDEVGALIATNRVSAATFYDEDAQIGGEFKATSSTPRDPEASSASLALRAPKGAGTFWVAYPRSDATTASLIDGLTQSGATVDVDPQSTKGIVRLLLTVLLPLMILANLFALFLTWTKGSSSGIGEVTDFGSVGDRKVKGKDDTSLGFDDVAGINEAVIELREVVDYLADPARYDELGASPPKGVLLVGPPGVGKTLLAKAVAGEAGVPFFSVAGAEFVESLVGVGAARVRDLFRRVRAVAPAIVFIDELDAAGRKRGAGGGSGGSDEREQTLNQLLVEMDGFDAGAGIVVMAATNRPDILDPALLRPGRFDRHITIEKPDVQARQEILELHGKSRRRVATHVDFGDIARRTPGFSGADLANVVNEAALLTIRQNLPEITESEFNEAIARVMSGPKRRGHLMAESERRRIAVHEAGHAMAGALLGSAKDVHRVSIVARGTGAGATGLHRDEDAVVLSRGQLHSQLVVTLAGTAAEELVLNEPSTGGDDDLERATSLAKEMVGKFGMSELGKIRILAPESEQFLGDSAVIGDVSAGLHEAFDNVVRATITDALDAATELLALHAVGLDALVAALLEMETLEGEALAALLPASAATPNGKVAPTAVAAVKRRTAPAKKRTAKKSTARRTPARSN